MKINDFYFSLVTDHAYHTLLDLQEGTGPTYLIASPLFPYSVAISSLVMAFGMRRHVREVIVTALDLSTSDIERVIQLFSIEG